MANQKVSTSEVLSSVVPALIVAMVAGCTSNGSAEHSAVEITIPADRIQIVSKQTSKPPTDQTLEAISLVDKVRAKLKARAENGGLVLLVDGKVLGKPLSARAEYWFDGGLRLRATADGQPLSAVQSKCLVESINVRRCFDGDEPPFIVRPIDPGLVLKAQASSKRCGKQNCRFVSIRSRLRENYSLNPAQPIWFEFDPRDGWIKTEIMMTEELDLVSMTITRKFKKIELVKNFVPLFASSVEVQ